MFYVYICVNKTYIISDEVAEWLRRWTANPMGSARVGSNPILVEIFSNFFNIFFLNILYHIAQFGFYTE